jgi:hypothetical protein
MSILGEYLPAELRLTDEEVSRLKSLVSVDDTLLEFAASFLPGANRQVVDQA